MSFGWRTSSRREASELCVVLPPSMLRPVGRGSRQPARFQWGRVRGLDSRGGGRLASAKGATIETIHADLADYVIEPGDWDAVVSISAISPYPEPIGSSFGSHRAPPRRPAVARGIPPDAARTPPTDHRPRGCSTQQTSCGRTSTFSISRQSRRSRGCDRGKAASGSGSCGPGTGTQVVRPTLSPLVYESLSIRQTVLATFAIFL